MIRYMMVAFKNSLTTTILETVDLETGDYDLASDLAYIEMKHILKQYPCAVYDVMDERHLDELLEDGILSFEGE